MRLGALLRLRLPTFAAFIRLQRVQVVAYAEEVEDTGRRILATVSGASLWPWQGRAGQLLQWLYAAQLLLV